MPVIGVETSKDEWDLFNSWEGDKVSGAEVLKDFTEEIEGNKIVIIKTGTKSHKYESCNFHFLSDDGEDVAINVATVSKNEKYFKKIPTIQNVNSELQTALESESWKNHKIGDTYSMINVGGKKDDGIWRIAYYPIFGTYKGEDDKKQWIEFGEPRALIEKALNEGNDLREMPLRYLSKNI